MTTYGLMGLTSTLGASAGVGAFLTLAAFIAAVVLTVLGYRKYAMEPRQAAASIDKNRELGRFLRFETMLIEKILIVLYLFTALFVALEGCAAVLTELTSLFSSGSHIGYVVGPVVGGIIFTAAIVVVLEVAARLGFELIMVIVKICRNTAALRKAAEKDAGISSASSDSVISEASTSAADWGRHAAPSVEDRRPTAIPVPAPAKDSTTGIDYGPGQDFTTEIGYGPGDGAATGVGRTPDKDTDPIVAAANDECTAFAGAPAPATFPAPDESFISSPQSRNGEAPAGFTFIADVESIADVEGVESVDDAQAEPLSETLWVCGTCGAENDRGSYCSQCGTPR